MTPTVDVDGAADLMKVHPVTVLELIGDGTLPAGKIGRAYVILTKDVLGYVESIVVKQTAERLGLPARQGRKSARSLPRKLA